MSANYDAYRIFYYVGKYGNITRAATELFISQSTVSRSILSLENELQCKLFERYPYGVSLTREGQVLFEQVSQAYEHITLGENNLRQMQAARYECIRVGVTEFTFTQYILPILPAFGEKYPDVRLEFCSQKALIDDAVFSGLSNGVLDMLCTISPIPVQNSFLSTVIDEFSDVLVAGEKFNELKNTPVDIASLRSYPVVTYSNFQESQAVLDPANRLQDFALFQKYCVDSGSYFMQIVRQGQCLAVIPQPIFRTLDGMGRFFRVNVSTPLPRRQVILITLRDRDLSPAGHALSKMIQTNAHYSTSLY